MVTTYVVELLMYIYRTNVEIYSYHLMIPTPKAFIDDTIVKHCVNTRASLLYITWVLVKQIQSVVFKEL